MEPIGNIDTQRFQDVQEGENERDGSKALALAKSALDEGAFEIVVGSLLKVLENSPLGEILSDKPSEFFSILESLFYTNKDYFEPMIPLLEHHQMKMTWTAPYYFSITHYTPSLAICYKMASKLDSYDYNTAAKIISMYDDSRIKIDAYLGLSLKFQETHWGVKSNGTKSCSKPIP